MNKNTTPIKKKLKKYLNNHNINHITITTAKKTTTIKKRPIINKKTETLKMTTPT